MRDAGPVPEANWVESLARIIADELGGELDVVLVRKLRAPGQPGLAIDAVVEA